MDSEKRQNWTLIVALLMGIPNWLMLALMFWFRWYPEPSKEPNIIMPANALTTGWLPVIVVSAITTFYMIGLLVVAFRRLKNKRIAKDLAEAKREWQEWERKYWEEHNENVPIKRLKDNLEGQLKESEKQLLGVRKQYEGALHDAKQANLRAKQEINQKDEFYKHYQKSEQRLSSWSFLIKLAEDQAKAISDFVVITNIVPTRLNLESGADRVVGVTVHILNNSVFDITISPAKVKGNFHFENKPRQESIHVPIDADHLPIEKLKPKQPATLYIEQPLRKFEAERISEADDKTAFWLGSLSIPITIENAPSELEFKQDADMIIPPLLADIPVYHFLL